MTGENVPQFDPALLEVGGEELVVRLLDESGEVVRFVVRQRLDLHGWLGTQLLGWGNFDERYVHLLLLMLPELWLRHQEGAAATLRQLHDAESRSPATVAAAHEWVVNVGQGMLDHLYPGLSTWVLEHAP